MKKNNNQTQTVILPQGQNPVGLQYQTNQPKDSTLTELIHKEGKPISIPFHSVNIPLK